MSHFMSQCEDIIQAAMIIQQNIRMCAVCSPGIGSCPFAFILIDIDPPVIKSFLQKRLIIFSQRCQCLLHNFSGFLKTVFLFRGFYHWHINIIHMQFFQTKQLFSKSHITIHGRKPFFHSCNQVLVYFHRNAAAIQCFFHCIGITMLLCKKVCLLCIAIISC